MPDDFDEMPEEKSEDLDQPPSFFPYESTEARRVEDFGEPVEVSVEGVFAAENNGSVQQFVLLSDGDRKLPIMIGPFEATAITLALEGATPDRPMTHDLVKTLLDRLDASVDRVVIDDLWSTTYYAKIFIQTENEEISVDSRPSDAIAVALRCEASIYVADGILAQANE